MCGGEVEDGKEGEGSAQGKACQALEDGEDRGDLAAID